MMNVVLIMHRKAVAQGLMNKLRNSSDISLIYEPDYNNANFTIRNHNADAILIEATESGPYDINYCLILCKKLRKQIPECKLLLMCSEHDDTSIELVMHAKGIKLIDDFVFYDVTIDYLASKLLAI